VSKHSPGPWTWTRESVGRHVQRLVDADGRAVFWPVPDPRASAPGGMQSTDINCPNEDNARLLAAAPEMLKLLRRATASAIKAKMGLLCDDAWERDALTLLERFEEKS
jgi:hypothetical protein